MSSHPEEALYGYDPLALVIHLCHRMGDGMDSLGCFISAAKDFTNWAKGRIENGDPIGTVLDIGAHRGMVSMAARRLGCANLLAVEPNKDNVRCLKENLALVEGRGQYAVIQAAVSSKVGMGLLQCKAGSSGQNSMRFTKSFADRSETVETVTFHHLIDRAGVVDYCKIDVEGAEYDIFDGGDAAVSSLRRVGWLNLELHGADTSIMETTDPEGEDARLRDTLRRAGFAISDTAMAFRGPQR